MDEMIRYIFGSLRCSETAMRVFAKTLRKQRFSIAAPSWSPRL